MYPLLSDFPTSYHYTAPSQFSLFDPGNEKVFVIQIQPQIQHQMCIVYCVGKWVGLNKQGNLIPLRVVSR